MMIKIMEINNLDHNKVWLMREAMGPYYVFFERTIEQQAMFYSQIHAYHIENHTLQPYVFDSNVQLISEGNYAGILYFASLHKDANGSSFVISKLILDGFIKEDIISIPLHIDINLDIYTLRSSLVSIDERYCLFFLPNKNFSFNANFYSEVLLIDSSQKTSYSLSMNSTTYSDVLLNLSECKIGNKGNTIVFKAGRINSFEKRAQWKKSNNDYTSEALLVLDKTDFVTSVMNKSDASPLMNTKFEGNETIGIIGKGSETLIYFKENFEEDITEVYSIQLASGKTVSKFQIDEHFSSIVAYSDRLYGAKENTKNGHYSYLSFADQKTHVLGSDVLVYLDENVTITARPHHIGSFNLKIKMTNMIENKLFTDKKYLYDFERNTLIIY
ncbi:hypothetical protein [Paenibacillus elgii]|uniref:hypothetical protein n=1 Tax=Paenibacillus elgii TaxID=189691 RepID=UPI0013D395AE|nr:hypothetical protein [Paenibacillus elgii]